MFRPDGSWVPDQPINNQVPNQNMGAIPQIRPTLQMNPQVPMQFNPQMNPFAGNQMTMAGSMPGGPNGFGNNQINMNNPVTITRPQAQGQQIPWNNPRTQIGPIAPGQQQFNDPYQAPQPLAQNYSPQQMPLSMTQSVDHANPQNVQNYLRALHNSPQAGQNNAWRNPAGMQGQDAQGGFQGFQQNGAQSYGQQAVQYQQPTANYQLNNANTRVNPGGQAQFVQGGKGGVAGQPQYQQGGYISGFGGTPAPKTNPYQHQDLFHKTGEEQGGGNLQSPGAGGAGGNKGEYEGPPGKNNGGGNYHPPGSGNNDNTDSPAYSDINVKQDIKKGDAQLQEFLDSLGVYDYEYKDPKYGEGRRISPMAQEIEKTPLGKAAISTNNEGYKIVDYGKLGGTMLASLAMLNHKYNELEESIKKGLISKGKLK